MRNCFYSWYELNFLFWFSLKLATLKHLWKTCFFFHQPLLVLEVTDNQVKKWKFKILTFRIILNVSSFWKVKIFQNFVLQIYHKWNCHINYLYYFITNYPKRKWFKVTLILWFMWVSPSGSLYKAVVKVLSVAGVTSRPMGEGFWLLSSFTWLAIGRIHPLTPWNRLQRGECLQSMPAEKAEKTVSRWLSQAL